MPYAKDIDIYIDQNWSKTHVVIDGVEIPATSIEIRQNSDGLEVKVGLIPSDIRLHLKEYPQIEMVGDELIIQPPTKKGNT
jgi:hypothetical protein